MASPVPYELRIAVTGHRAIRDEEGLSRAIEGVLDRINRLLVEAHAPPPSWTIVSPLARGADQVAARTLMEHVNARLEVLTPFPLAEYRKDFAPDGDLARHEELLARAAVVDELPHRGQATEVHPGDGEASKTLREAAYLRAGERVVEASEILLAIWNGRQAAGTGGTAEIVEYALERDRVVLWIDAEHPEQPPRRIRSVTYQDRSDDTASIGAVEFPPTLKELSPGYSQQLGYFRDGSLTATDYDMEERRTRNHLSAAAIQAGLPAEALDGILAGLVPQFARADVLAQLYHGKHVRAVTGVLYLAALAVTIAVAQVVFFPEHLWVILLEVVAMLAVLGLWLSAGSGGWHEKWLHARYLAEGLRVGMFMALFVPESRQGQRGDPLPFYRGPQQWLAQTVKTIVIDASRKIPPLPLGPLQQFLIHAWLKDQQRFHAHNAQRKEKSAHRRHRLGFALFGATLLMAVLHLTGVGHASEAMGARILQPGLWITFFALVLPAWAGSVHAVTSQLELERISERSHRMATALESLAHRALRATTLEELRLTAKETADLMMIENHEWWVLLSFQGARLHV